MSGQVYRGFVFGLPARDALPRLVAWVALLRDQFGWLPLASCAREGSGASLPRRWAERARLISRPGDVTMVPGEWKMAGIDGA